MKALTSAKTRIACGLALAGCLSLPAFADNAYDEIVVSTSKAGIPSATVSYNDLNLNSAEGREDLHERVSYAARAVCSHSDLKRAGSRALSVRESETFRSCYDSAFSAAMSSLTGSALVMVDR